MQRCTHTHVHCMSYKRPRHIQRKRPAVLTAYKKRCPIVEGSFGGNQRSEKNNIVSKQLLTTRQGHTMCTFLMSGYRLEHRTLALFSRYSHSKWQRIGSFKGEEESVKIRLWLRPRGRRKKQSAGKKSNTFVVFDNWIKILVNSNLCRFPLDWQMFSLLMTKEVNILTDDQEFISATHSHKIGLMIMEYKMTAQCNQGFWE